MREANGQKRIITRADLVREADEWLDTPWAHGQSVKGKGADCVGFLRGIARFVGHSEIPFEAYARISDERQAEQGWRMITLLDENLVRLASPYDARPGDWYAFVDQLSKLPQHVGMVRRYEGGQWQIIHASLKNGVRFNRMDRRQMRLIHAAYKVPGVSE